jgi:hypothetical protein
VPKRVYEEKLRKIELYVIVVLNFTCQDAGTASAMIYVLGDNVNSCRASRSSGGGLSTNDRSSVEPPCIN